MTKTAETIENRRKRLLYRAMHRGFKEADIMIGGFAADHLDHMDEEALDEFEAIIAHQDKLIYEWITNKQDPPADLVGPVFKAMQAFDAAKAVRDMTAI